MKIGDEHNINHEYITRYIEATIKKSEGLLLEIEQYAEKNSVPIAKRETIKFIEVLLKSIKAKNVLEIGSAIGYSAISMAFCGCMVTTIERSEEMQEQLHKNIKLANMEQNIKVICGDATELLPNLTGEYDFIFVDAAKGQYLEYLPHCLRMLKVGGVLFSDNILYKGMVATDELFVRRKITIIRRLRKYLDEICNRDDLDTAIVPVGDGAAISYKIMGAV